MTLHLSAVLLTVSTLTCLSSSASSQSTKVDCATASVASGAHIELSGPQSTIHVWAASEWSLRLDNQAADPLPCSTTMLTPAGIGYAKMCFEVARDGKVVREFASRSFDTSSNCASPGRVVEPRNIGELPIVLHGEVINDIAARKPGERRSRRFEPAFESPGQHSVTAVLYWGNRTFRSNSVTVTVAQVPLGAEHALQGLKDLAKSGICIDVQGVNYNSPAMLELIAAFVQAEKYTLYGAQLQLGLAQARLFTPGSVTPDNAKSLLPQYLPLDFGLERSLAGLRAIVPVWEEDSE